MKSLVIVLVSVGCLLVAVQAAAVETVVELQKDSAALQKDEPKANSDNSTLETDILVNEECIQPKEVGRCFALFYRFAYDVEKHECVEFIYGGCNGNSNNFETKEECEVKCLKHTPSADSGDDHDGDVGLASTVPPNAEAETTTAQAAVSP